MSPSDPPDQRPPDLPPRFASVVAHELHNPLSAVKMALQTVERAQDLSPRDARRLQIALREVGTLERLLDLILRWARPPDLLLQPLSLSEVFDEALSRLSALRQEQQTRLDLRIDPGLWVLGDAEELPGAVSELLRNAFEAAGDGGLVQVRAWRRAGRVVTAITDDGPPTGREELQRAFEPFWSGKPRGVGLGLTTARAILQGLGARLSLQPTDDGRGLVATLDFIASEEPEREDRAE